METNFTQKELKSILHYNPNTGVWIWVKHRKSTEIGKIAGCLDHGYWRIRYNNKIYYAHRLAFMYMTGVWPKGKIDHKDRNGGNCKWENLRDTNQTYNNANSIVKINNKSGLKGVSWSKWNKCWRTDIAKDGVKYYSFHDTKEKAKAAYNQAALKLFGDFARE